MTLNPEEMDLDALLGVRFGRRKEDKLVEAGQRPPKLPPRRAEHHNLRQFTFNGYVAKVLRHTCSMCDRSWDQLIGIFVEELHTSPVDGRVTRRLQQLAPNGDWPAGGGHRKEVELVEDRLCGECIGGLGFDVEVDSEGQPFAIVIKEE